MTVDIPEVEAQAYPLVVWGLQEVGVGGCLDNSRDL
jgi:hypothetical protein